MPEALSDKLLDEVRERIDRQYREAIDGLEAIKRFLGPNATGIVMSQTPVETGQNGASKRAKVLGALDSDWLTVGQISEKSGLPDEDVRAVLYAKNFDAGIRKRHFGKRVRFCVIRPKGGDP